METTFAANTLITDSTFDQPPSTVTAVAEVPVRLAEASVPVSDIPAIVLLSTAAGAAGVAYLNHRISKRRKAAAEAAAAENQHVDRSLSYAGTTLVLNNVLGHVNITESDTDEMSVTVGGRKKIMDDINLTRRKGRLAVTGKQPIDEVFALSPGADFTSKVLRHIAKRAGLLVLDSEDWLQVNATVPSGTNVIVAGLNGSLCASAALGNIDMRTISGHKTTIQQAKNTKLRLGSNAQATIGTVDGTLDANVGYNGLLSVQGGTITALDATLGSYSRLNVAGQVLHASVDCGYNSKAELQSASGEVWLRTASYSQIGVQAGKATLLTIINGYNGNISFLGAAEAAHMTTQSYGHIALGAISGPLAYSGGYSSRATVGQGTATNCDIRLGSYAQLTTGCRLEDGDLHTGYSSRTVASSYGNDLQIHRASYAQVLTK